MQFTHVETIEVQAGQMDETLRKAESDLMPQYRNLPGFVAYTIAQTDKVSAIGMSIWQTREQAEYSVVIREDWLKKGARKLIGSCHDAIGSLPFLACTNSLVAYTSATPVAARRV